MPLSILILRTDEGLIAHFFMIRRYSPYLNRGRSRMFYQGISPPETLFIVHVQGAYQDQVLHIFVNHWPSNYGGKEKAIPKRAATADLLENIMLDILADDPDADILLIGDFNEEPIDTNIKGFIDMNNGKRSARPFTNLMEPLVGKPGVGTYVYRGQDNLIDQIIVSSGLMNSGSLKILPGSLEILDQPKYRQQEGKYAHYPFRFWAGNRLLGGYSDHLTVSCTLIMDD